MNPFYSPPSNKSAAIKFSYSSPPHHTFNIFSSNHTDDSYPQNCSALRTLTNTISKTHIRQKQAENKRNALGYPHKCGRKEKQNFITDSKKMVFQSVIINNSKQENLNKHESFPIRLEDIANRKRTQDFSATDSFISLPSNKQHQNDQKLEFSGIFNKQLSWKQNQSHQTFNFSKVRPRNRRIEAKLSNAKVEDFIFGQMIGKGSIGRVFLVEHIKTNFYYALKVIKKKEVQDINQLIFGIKCHCFFNHPNLAQLYACFGDQNNLYLLMELCVDGNLSKYRKKIKNDEQRDQIIMGIAKGVQYMHKFFLRHGDMKLQNILINHGFSKITDFDCVFSGTNKSFVELRRKSKLWGSPAYFSPDMMRQNTFVLQDDIWSFGIIMYEVYCASHPFNLKDTDDLSNIIEKDMNPIPPDVKESAKILIVKMLDKNRQTRATIQQILGYCV